MLRNDLDTRSESTGKQCGDSDVKTKNIQCDPTKKLHVKSKWSDVVGSGSVDRRNEGTTSRQIIHPNITSPSTEEQWKTVSRGPKKLPTVNHTSFYQIPVIANHYELFRNKGNDEQIVREPMRTHELEVEDTDKIWKKTHKQKEKKHRIIIIGDSHAWGCAAEIKSNLDKF